MNTKEYELKNKEAAALFYTLQQLEMATRGEDGKSPKRTRYKFKGKVRSNLVRAMRLLKGQVEDCEQSMEAINDEERDAAFEEQTRFDSIEDPTKKDEAEHQRRLRDIQRKAKRERRELNEDSCKIVLPVFDERDLDLETNQIPVDLGCELMTIVKDGDKVVSEKSKPEEDTED